MHRMSEIISLVNITIGVLPYVVTLLNNVFLLRSRDAQLIGEGKRCGRDFVVLHLFACEATLWECKCELVSCSCDYRDICLLE